MRWTLLALTTACSAASLADVLWERSFDSPGFSVGEVSQFAKEPSTGSLFVKGDDARQYVVWKFNRWGSLYYRTVIDPGFLLVGKHNDFFTLSQDGLSRYDSTTGQRIWRQTESHDTRAFVDESGDVYTWDNVNWARKFSFLDGQKVWQAECRLIPIDGPDLIASTLTGPKLLSRSTGLLRPLTMPVPVSNHIEGVQMAGGKALLRSSENRLFGFRGSGSSVLNLGLMNSQYDGITSSSDGGVLFSGSVGSMHMDQNFQTGWTSPFRFTSTEGNLAFVSTLAVQSFSLLNGSALRSFYPSLDTNRTYTTHADAFWIGGSSGRRASIEFFNQESTTRSGGWSSTTKGNREDEPRAGIIGPSGDLLMVTRSETSLELSRVAATTGIKRWTLDLGESGGALNLSLSADKRILCLTAGGDQARTYEIDVTQAKLTRTYAGWGLVAGTNVYRQTGATTSKFEISTGRELWRVPRTGPIGIDPDGSVYIGRTKNAGTNGQLRWTSAASVVSPFTRAGDKLIARTDGNLVCIDPGTGAVVWSSVDYASYAAAEKPMCRLDGVDLYVKNGESQLWKRFNLFSGQLLATRNAGFWNPDGSFCSYRIADHKLYRYASFDDLTGSPIGELAVTPRRYVTEPSGSGYFLGVAIGPRGDWDANVVSWTY